MSYFNHETFGAGHMPPFETIFDIKQKQNTLRYTLSETIEDVEYVEITDEQPKAKEALKWDKTARKKEIWDEAMKEFSEMGINSSIMKISHAILFEFGADWSDQNPVSHFEDKFRRGEAFSEAADKKLEEYKKLAEKERLQWHSHLDLIILMTASFGFQWATENPPKYY